MPSPLDVLELPFLRTALVELALLATAGGALGAWIVLRRLAFFTHAVGGAALPALILAGPAGVSVQLAGVAAGLGYAAGVERASRSNRDFGPATGLLLAGSLAAGAVLASDVVGASGGVDRLLFGTLLGLGADDLAFSAGAVALAALASLVLGRAWTALGFDPDAASALGLPSGALHAALLAIVAMAAVTAVPAVGALLVTALFIVPAATARLLARSVHALLAWSVALALLESVAGLYLAYALDVPPGPAIASLGAAAYALMAVALRWRSGAAARRAPR